MKPNYKLQVEGRILALSESQGLDIRHVSTEDAVEMFRYWHKSEVEALIIRVSQAAGAKPSMYLHPECPISLRNNSGEECSIFSVTTTEVVDAFRRWHSAEAARVASNGDENLDSSVNVH